MKELFLSIIRAFKNVFNKIFAVIKRIMVFIASKITAVAKVLISILKKIVTVIAKVFKTLSKTIWNYFLKYVWIGLKFIGKNIYLLLVTILKYFYKYFIRYILKGIKYISLMIYRGLVILTRFMGFKILKPIGKFFWLVFKKIYLIMKTIITTLWKFVKPIIDFIHKIVEFIVEKIAKAFVFLFEKLFLLFKYLGIVLQKFARFIYQLFKKIIVFIKNIIKKVINGIKQLLIFIKNSFKSLPEPVYLFIYTLFIYLYLFLRFLFVDSMKFIFWIFPKMLYELITSFLNIIISLFENTVIKIIRFLYKYISIFFKKLFFIISQIFGWLYEYYYVLLLFPIVLPVFVISFVVLTIKNIFIYIYVLLMTITHQQISHQMEAVIVKVGYLPSILLIQNSQAILKTYRYNYLFSSKLQNLIQNIDVLVWQSIYMMILVPIGVIALTPITLFLIFFYIISGKDFFTFVSNEDINGLVSLPKSRGLLKKYQFKIQAEYLYDNENNMIVLEDQRSKVNIIIYQHNEILKQLVVPVSYDEEYLLIKAINEISNKITIDNHFIDLPINISNDLEVSYEKIYYGDDLYGGTLRIRPHATQTAVKVRISLMNSFKKVERIIHFDNIINPQLINEDELLEKTYYLNKNESLVKLLDKRLKYVFMESDEVTIDGVVTTRFDKTLRVKFFIENIPEKVYQANVNLIFDKDSINEILGLIPAPEVDFFNRAINLQDNLVLDELYSKEISWYLNGKVYNKIQEDHYFNQKNLTFEAYIIIAGKTYVKKFKYYNPMLYGYVIRDLQQYIDNVDLSNQFIQLPIFLDSYARAIKWKSFSPQLIKSSGKVINRDFKEIIFEVTLYRNIFLKKKLVINSTKKII